jgi:hypothetical protein
VNDLFLVAGLLGAGVIFVATVGLVDRLLGAGYGRRGRLPQRIVSVVSVVTAFAAVFLVALIWFRWF